jgi:RNA-binding protein 5/10
MLRDESCVTSSLAMGGVEGTWAKYWDESATVVELKFEVEAPVPSVAPERDSKPKKKKEQAKGM